MGLQFTRRGMFGAGAVAVIGGSAFALRGGGGRHRRLDPFTLYRGNRTEPDTLDPTLASTTYETNIVGDMFMGLMTENPAADPTFGAALRYDMSPDGLEMTFHLRDHTWSDGVPVTADDFVFAWRRIVDPRTAAQFAISLYPVENAKAINGGKLPPEALGARAVDARTLKVRFATAVPYFAQWLTHYSTYPVPQHAVAKFGDAWTKPGNSVSNGAYVLKEWVPNEHILLEKNPHYFAANSVKIERVYFYPLQDYAMALKRFRAGELDVNLGVPAQEIPWVELNMAPDLHIAPYLATNYLTFNVAKKPFDDPRVRAAVSLAIDRDVICRKVMRGGEQPAYAFVPPHMPNYPGRAQLAFRDLPMRARLEKARALLSAAGFGPANPLAFDYNIENESDPRLTAVALQAMWSNVGAEVRILPSDAKDHYNTLTKHAYHVAAAAWVADWRDAGDFLMLGQTDAAELNDSGYSNPRFDSLMTRAATINNLTQRAQILTEAEQVLLDDGAIAPVYFGVTRTLVSTAVKGWVDNQIAINRTRYLSVDRSRTV